jgi:hypothetical protein
MKENPLPIVDGRFLLIKTIGIISMTTSKSVIANPINKSSNGSWAMPAKSSACSVKTCKAAKTLPCKRRYSNELAPINAINFSILLH